MVFMIMDLVRRVVVVGFRWEMIGRIVLCSV